MQSLCCGIHWMEDQFVSKAHLNKDLRRAPFSVPLSVWENWEGTAFDSPHAQSSSQPLTFEQYFRRLLVFTSSASNVSPVRFRTRMEQRSRQVRQCKKVYRSKLPAGKWSISEVVYCPALWRSLAEEYNILHQINHGVAVNSFYCGKSSGFWKR